MSNLKKVEVVAAVIVKDGCVLATQRGYGEFEGKWEFPGGKIQEGESQEEALIREIKEEMHADIDVIDFINTVDYDYPNFHLIMHTYVCNLKNNYEFVYHDDNKLEHSNMVWLDKNDLDKIDWLDADREVVKAYRRLHVVK